METKISIIVPVYNASKYLGKCLQSLINQTLPDIEIICINDGSTDNSLEILKEFEQKNVDIKVFSQKNKGQSIARNFGIRQAKGEYIGFLDADDWADEQMFEELYKNAKTFDSDIAMCSIKTYDETTREISGKDSYLTLDLFDETFENRAFHYSETLGFIFRICVVPWNKIYKREFLISNQILFPEGLSFEDNVFNLETFIKSEKISIVKKPLVYYRKGAAILQPLSKMKKNLLFSKYLSLRKSC